MGFVSKLLSLGSDKDLKRYYKLVDKINALEPTYEKMDEEELKKQTDLFRERYANGESLDSMLPEAFAVTREASKRVLGMRHFDVQLIGAMALHEGHIAEIERARARPWFPRSPATSTLSPARACTSSPSTTTWQSATPSGWVACTAIWA